MEKIFLTRPDEVFEAIAKRKKMAIFEVDDDGNPILPISEINVKKIEILPKNREIIRPALKYVHEHYNKEIRLDMLAGLCDVSKSYFCRLFKEAYGIGVAAYVINLRMDEACRLLEKTDNSVVSIAFEVGYVDCGYFNKLFKKHVGCTPLEYRRKPRFVFRDA